MSGEQYGYKSLLSDRNLKGRYDNLKRSRPSNADKCLQRVGYVYRVLGTPPDKMIAMSSKEAANLILDVLSRLEEEGKQPTYMQDYVEALTLRY